MALQWHDIRPLTSHTLKVYHVHCVSKKFPPLNSLYLYQNLTDFQNFCTDGKRMKFATKRIPQYPPHLRHVASYTTLGNKKCKFSADIRHILKKVQTNCIFIASTFVIHPQILIFSVFKIASFFSYWLQIEYFVSLLFYLFTFAITLWHWKLVTADVTAVFVNNQHGIQWREQ